MPCEVTAGKVLCCLETLVLSRGCVKGMAAFSTQSIDSSESTLPRIVGSRQNMEDDNNRQNNSHVCRTIAVRYI